MLNGVSTEAVVGLETTIFTVFEDVGRVELCAHVFEPDIDCPIEFPFDVVLSTADRTAGMYSFSQLMQILKTFSQEVLWTTLDFL